MKLTKRDVIIATAAAAIAGSIATAYASQPHMDRALDFLRSARAELNRASANKGGHRVKAINLVNKAIEEVRLGKVVGS